MNDAFCALVGDPKVVRSFSNVCGKYYCLPVRAARQEFKERGELKVWSNEV